MRIGESNSHIKIGDDCMFSENISIMASDTHAIVDELGNVVNVGKTIEIGNHVWVGMNSLILKNSKIMNNSIIGA